MNAASVLAVLGVLLMVAVAATACSSAERIVFVREPPGHSGSAIYVINADGSGQTRLTDAGGVYNASPTWSPDGSRIAFDSDRDGDGGIYVMDADGSDQTPLSDDDAHASGATWSPDGSRIAFVSNRDGYLRVYIMSADGSGRTRLTDSVESAFQPAWSP